MRIVHIGRPLVPLGYEFGGAVEKRIVQLASAQAALGHEVLIVGIDGPGNVGPHKGLQHKRIRCQLPRPARDYEYMLRAYAPIRAFRPDVLHVHGAPDSGLFLGRVLGVPVVLTVDYFRYKWAGSRAGRSYWRFMLAHADVLTAVSQACLAELLDFYDLSGDGRTVLYNGVDVRLFAPKKHLGQFFRDRYRIGRDSVVFGFCGRMCRQKGTHVLLEALRLAQVTEPDIKLILVGPMGQFLDESEDAGLRAMIAASTAEHIGSLDDREFVSALNAVDVFVMPTVHDEMFGMAALEAQAVGKAVIASDLGGLPEAVSKDGGVFVQPDNAEALAAAMLMLTSQTQRRLELGESGRAHAVAFRWEAIAERSIALYGDLPSGRH